MIYIAPSVLLTLEDPTSLRYPMFLWNNQVTAGSLTSDEEDASYPITNLGNPQTSSLWKAVSTADQTITVELDGSEVDCIGIARHNLGSGVCELTIKGITADPGAVWEDLAVVSPGSDDAPIIAIVEGGFYTSIQLSLAPSSVIPQMAVLYVGKALRMTRGIVPGFAPPVDSLETDMIVGIAENGDFLGDIISSQRQSTSLSFRPIPGDWYRENVRSFLKSRAPFFFAWSPLSYPSESAFAKFNGNPKAAISHATGHFDVSFSMTGIAL